MTIKVGALDTAETFSEFTVPLLIGIFFGLAERALPEALTRRAQDFIGRVSAAGAGTPPTRP